MYKYKHIRITYMRTNVHKNHTFVHVRVHNRWTMLKGHNQVSKGHNDASKGHNDVSKGHNDVSKGHNDVFLLRITI